LGQVLLDGNGIILPIIGSKLHLAIAFAILQAEVSTQIYVFRMNDLPYKYGKVRPKFKGDGLTSFFS
jgi:hypothetical protein